MSGPTIVTDIGAANANSYNSVEFIDAYFAARAPLDPPWIASGEGTAALAIMATELFDAMAVARKELRFDGRGGPQGRPYYVTSKAWTGVPATDVQALAFPRIGMYDRLGREIPADVLPIELKKAHAEMVGALYQQDRMQENDIELLGITSIRAGSVALTFKDTAGSVPVIPTNVMRLMPASWLTDEVITYATSAILRSLG